MLKDRPHRYFAFHYRMLRILGLGWWHHPDQDDSRNFPHFYIPYFIVTQLVWVVGFVGLETIDPFMQTKEVERLMFSLSFVITHDLTLVKLYLFYFRNKEIQDTIRTLEVEMYEYTQNNESNRRTIRKTKILTGSFLFFGWATLANSTINGAMQDFRWKATVNQMAVNETKPFRSLAQPIYIPWDYQSDEAYIATFILEAVGLIWTGHIVMIIDTFIGSIIMHMSSQFVTLQEAIVTLYDRSLLQLYKRLDVNISENVTLIHEDLEQIINANCTRKEIEQVLENNLKQFIRQHQVLIRCVDNFSKTYSYGFLTQLLSSMAAICVIMVQVSKDASTFKSIDFMTSLAFFIAMIIQLAIQCFTGNELSLQSQKVSEAVMQCGWEKLPARLRRPLVLVAARAQQPLRLTAAGFANMNNGCFLSIVKAAYSYYAVLSQKQ